MHNRYRMLAGGSKTKLFAVFFAAAFVITASNAKPSILQYPPPQATVNANSVCILCEITTEALRELYERNATQNTIMRIAEHLCEHYANYESMICQGMVSEFQDTLLYVIGELALRPSQLCGLLLSDCSRFHNPMDGNWTVNLPPPPSPPPAKNSVPRRLVGSPIFPGPPKGRPFQVLQLSDLHFDPLYAPGSEADCDQPICCQSTSAGRPAAGQPSPRQLAGYWGSVAKCDLPYRTILNMLQHINETHQIDYVLLTGDLMSHSDWTYTRRDHLEIIRTMNATLNALLPGVPIFWAIGNHEGVPINSFAPHFAPQRFRPDWLYHAVASAARRWMPDEQLSQALYRGSYSVLLTDQLKVISVNTGYCEIYNFFLYLNQTDPDGVLAWLVDELAGCELAGQHVHIIAHIPPGDAECLEGWARNYYRIINRFSGTIKAQFFGHVHTDSFTVFYAQMNDTTSQPTGVLYSTPSVTTFEGVNPAYRIYTVDGNTNEVLDFTTHFLNLTAIGDLPRWEPLYSAKTEYGLKDLSPASWQNLAHRIRTDDAMFRRFLKNYVRRDDFACDSACRDELLCTLSSGHHDAAALCAASRARRRARVEARALHAFARRRANATPAEFRRR